MREGGGLAGYPAQTEARADVIIGGLQSTVIEAERFGHAILQVEFAIIMRGKMPGGERLCGVGIEVAAIEETARVAAHEAALSATPPSRTKRRSQ